MFLFWSRCEDLLTLTGLDVTKQNTKMVQQPEPSLAQPYLEQQGSVAGDCES